MTPVARAASAQSSRTSARCVEVSPSRRGSRTARCSSACRLPPRAMARRTASGVRETTASVSPADTAWWSKRAGSTPEDRRAASTEGPPTLPGRPTERRRQPWPRPIRATRGARLRTQWCLRTRERLGAPADQRPSKRTAGAATASASPRTHRRVVCRDSDEAMKERTRVVLPMPDSP